MGRRDGLSASKSAANNNIPGPNSTVTNLVNKFQNVGLSLQDMVALSGKHFLHNMSYVNLYFNVLDMNVFNVTKKMRSYMIISY